MEYPEGRLEPARPQAQVYEERCGARTFNSLSGVRMRVRKEKAPSYTMGNLRPAAMPSKKLASIYAEKQGKDRHALATGSLCLNDMRASERPRHLKPVITLSNL